MQAAHTRFVAPVQLNAFTHSCALAELWSTIDLQCNHTSGPTRGANGARAQRPHPPQPISTSLAQIDAHTSTSATPRGTACTARVVVLLFVVHTYSSAAGAAVCLLYTRPAMLPAARPPARPPAKAMHAALERAAALVQPHALLVHSATTITRGRRHAHTAQCSAHADRRHRHHRQRRRQQCAAAPLHQPHAQHQRPTAPRAPARLPAEQ